MFTTLPRFWEYLDGVGLSLPYTYNKDEALGWSFAGYNLLLVSTDPAVLTLDTVKIPQTLLNLQNKYLYMKFIPLKDKVKVFVDRERENVPTNANTHRQVNKKLQLIADQLRLILPTEKSFMFDVGYSVLNDKYYVTHAEVWREGPKPFGKKLSVDTDTPTLFEVSLSSPIVINDEDDEDNEDDQDYPDWDEEENDNF
jgi:hypothetical protein